MTAHSVVAPSLDVITIQFERRQKTKLYKRPGTHYSPTPRESGAQGEGGDFLRFAAIFPPCFLLSFSFLSFSFLFPSIVFTLLPFLSSRTTFFCSSLGFSSPIPDIPLDVSTFLYLFPSAMRRKKIERWDRTADSVLRLTLSLTE